MLMLARGIATKTREFDLDKEEKLSRSDKLAKQAMEILKDAPKPNPQVPDEQWLQVKKEYNSEAHQALGLAASVRKNYDVAITEMKMAIDESPDPITMVRLAQVYNMSNKPDEALALLDKVNATPDLHPSIRQFAQAEKVRATQLKNAGPKPAAPGAPPQVEIKKQ
jgi:predicted negative regulator of RcsB-dependent stress response